MSTTWSTTTTLASVFASMGAAVAALALTLTKKPVSGLGGAARDGSKREGEAICLKLAILWIGSVAVVIPTQAYEWWGPWGYLIYCGTCAALYVTVPYAFPGPADRKLAISDRYITKANLWVAIFSFIGNYWYTHYFYRVLKARYTFDAHRLNDVPICLYLMTHAYFMFYHSFSNRVIRTIRDTFERNAWRTLFEWAVIGALSYATAFGEAITICAFPHYAFQDVHQAYTLGSAFYAIYFVVSYPAFFLVDEPAFDVLGRVKKKRRWHLAETAQSALAASMLVLCLLDFVRLALGIALFAPYEDE